MKLQKVLITLSYIGSNYHGWQRQKHTQLTIQETIENTLTRLTKVPITVLASGRTDTGVHARIQLAQANLPYEFVKKMLAPNEKLQKTLSQSSSRLVHALNSLLPQDIRVLKVEPVDSNFQILKQAKRKTYLYFFNLNTIHDPSIKDFSWSLKLPLDIKSMQKAAKLFIGEHDFSLFCSSQSSAKSKVRTIYESEFGWVQGLGFWNQKILVYRITGNGFLKQMVRFIVGTLVQVGKGKFSESEVRDFLLGKKNKKAGPTAPPNGLWLWDIDLKY